MAIPIFKKLYDNHPYPEHPCNPDTFVNQCAIRMGVCFEKSGIDTTSFDAMYPNRRCYPGFKHKPRHILAAQELANWMKSQTATFGTVTVHQGKGGVTYKDFMYKKGIVFIKNGWGPTDHIDLWDGADMKGGSKQYFALGQQVWFWVLQ